MLSRQALQDSRLLVIMVVWVAGRNGKTEKRNKSCLPYLFVPCESSTLAFFVITRFILKIPLTALEMSPHMSISASLNLWLANARTNSRRYRNKVLHNALFKSRAWWLVRANDRNEFLSPAWLIVFWPPRSFWTLQMAVFSRAKEFPSIGGRRCSLRVAHKRCTLGFAYQAKQRIECDSERVELSCAEIIWRRRWIEEFGDGKGCCLKPLGQWAQMQV